MNFLNRLALQTILACLVCVTTDAQDKIVRRPLLTASPINKMVRSSEVKEIIFAPLQKTGIHVHPCPVVGYVVTGAVAFQVRGHALQTIKAGEAFYEPANTVISRFDNASGSQTLKFICIYLRGEEKEIIKMLPEVESTNRK